MYSFTPVTYTLKPGTPAQYTNGITDNARMESKAVNNLLSSIGHSRFSIVGFGNTLFAHASEDEKDKTLLAFLYYVNALSGEDTDRGRLAAKIMNTMYYHEYVR